MLAMLGASALEREAKPGFHDRGCPYRQGLRAIATNCIAAWSPTRSRAFTQTAFLAVPNVRGVHSRLRSGNILLRGPPSGFIF
jgi:hypothetical protein